MPLKTESPMDQKQRIVSLAESGRFTITELAREFGVSRKSIHKWIDRHRAGGYPGLAERSRAPLSQPGKTATELEKLIVSERRRRPTWGPKKIRQRLMREHGIDRPPAMSTIGDILKRNGLIEARRRRPGIFRIDREDLTESTKSNEVWATDFKGWFHLGDHSRCDPLTISDLHSRYLIRIEALPQATRRWTMANFRLAFQNYGLPETIRVDNGSPFASMGPGNLSKLSAWWVNLGIRVEFTRPGCPQDNGCHERMHRTMKAECCRPASVNLAAQQQRFDRWRRDFNQERPHESLQMRYPADLYQASNRTFDEGIKTTLYNPGAEVKRVNESGAIAVAGERVFVGEALAGMEVELRRSGKPDKIMVYFANILLGECNASSSDRLRPTASATRRKKRP